MQMAKRGLISVVLAWVVLMLINYYYVPFFFTFFEWLWLCLLFLILSIIQIIKLVKERHNLSGIRVQKTIVFSTLFVLTFFNVSDKIIERVDWSIFFNRRKQIVEQVRNKKLNPNVPWRSPLCKLPYQFPVISNGGNYIEIDENRNDGFTVKFYIYSNYMEAPSTYFIYTNDPEEVKSIEERIKKYPLDNWKICENWFRVEAGPYDGI
jgi:hypothetical protein